MTPVAKPTADAGTVEAAGTIGAALKAVDCGSSETARIGDESPPP